MAIMLLYTAKITNFVAKLHLNNNIKLLNQ